MVHIDNYFLDPFDTLNIKILATISYILALPGCCVALGFIWYEASGRAGPYRTCINQLVSRLYLLVSFYCVFINFVDLIRVWNGPLPEFICTPMQVTRLGITMKGSFLLIVLSIMKTWIVCIRKSVPTMDDNFVVTFVTRASVMLSILYSSTLVILPQKPALAHVSPERNWLISRNLPLWQITWVRSNLTILITLVLSKISRKWLCAKKYLLENFVIVYVNI